MKKLYNKKISKLKLIMKVLKYKPSRNPMLTLQKKDILKKLIDNL